MVTHLKFKETTFYEQLQNSEQLDLRDGRGKFLNLAHILLGITLGLLRNRDGNLSSIHRSMKNTNKILCSFLEIREQQVVSRAHLPIVLHKVNLPLFEQLLFDNYGIELNEQEKEWFAGDGKELRGSIEKGDKRGEAIVQLARHGDREILGQSFYNGKKESEKPCVRELLVQTQANKQKISLDALHLNPATTEVVNKQGGIFLIGLKDNQQILNAAMKKYAEQNLPIDQAITLDKGHGRVEKRSYFHYDISQQEFAPRWKDTNFNSLFKVERQRYVGNTGKESKEVDYYVSNGKLNKQEDYFSAIRGHWSIEVNNHVRDVTLREDEFKTKKKPLSKVMAGLRTLTIKLLGLIKPKNMVAQLEFFVDDFQGLLFWLRSVNFL